MRGTAASETGVVPRSGVTAPADEPTVESGRVPEVSAGAVAAAPLLGAFFFSSTGALEAGVGVGVGAGCGCPPVCAATASGDKNNARAKTSRTFSLIITFELDEF
jgi:hypothetical protein